MISILLLGGRQASGPGLAAENSYIAQLTRRFRADGLQPTVHTFYPIDLKEAGNWLKLQPLALYDLVVLQPDFGSLSSGILRQQLSILLGHVHMVRHRTVLITPLPQRTRKRLRTKRRAICLGVARRWVIPCLDTSAVLQAGDEFFQVGTDENLSAVAHELLASELHDAYYNLLMADGQPSADDLPSEAPAWRRYFYSYMTTRR
ncbi:hypothetical protein [Fibrella aquatilis]|uniref:Uncharacterized protein n=1 Tax=Fibrella aquatilis TaxID=2817059 RepID=A0A939JZU4_9BACT|nr:hypothetical protein [Fibrella aquatilis]MBO0931301.1 hypothetical protein [Fibrella aquatilis]